MSYNTHNFQSGSILYASQLNEMDNQLQSVSANLDNVVLIDEASNMVSQTELQQGYMDNGHVVANANYYTTGYIKVTQGVNYVKRANPYNLGTSANLVYMYTDKNESSYLGSWGSTQLDTAGYWRTFKITRTDVVYIRFVSRVTEDFVIYMGKGSTIPESLEDADKQVIDRNVYMYASNIIGMVRNELYGKKIALNGDSICYGAGDSGGYGKYLQENDGMTVQNIGASGATIAAGTTYSDTGNNRHWICRTIENLDADADFVIIEGGVNDASLGVPLGTLTNHYKTAAADYDDTTFIGAMEKIAMLLTTRFAGKKYGYMAVHQMTYFYRADNEANQSYYHAALAVCKKWGIPVLDLNTAVPPYANFTTATPEALQAVKNAYTYNGDGWHPNALCYKTYYVPRIEAWLKNGMWDISHGENVKPFRKIATMTSGAAKTVSLTGCTELVIKGYLIVGSGGSLAIKSNIGTLVWTAFNSSRKTHWSKFVDNQWGIEPVYAKYGSTASANFSAVAENLVAYACNGGKHISDITRLCFIDTSTGSESTNVTECSLEIWAR